MKFKSRKDRWRLEQADLPPQKIRDAEPKLGQLEHNAVYHLALFERRLGPAREVTTSGAFGCIVAFVFFIIVVVLWVRPGAGPATAGLAFIVGALLLGSFYFSRRVRGDWHEARLFPPIRNQFILDLVQAAYPEADLAAGLWGSAMTVRLIRRWWIGWGILMGVGAALVLFSRFLPGGSRYFGFFLIFGAGVVAVYLRDLPIHALRTVANRIAQARSALEMRIEPIYALGRALLLLAAIGMIGSIVTIVGIILVSIVTVVLQATMFFSTIRPLAHGLHAVLFYLMGTVVGVVWGRVAVDQRVTYEVRIDENLRYIMMWLRDGGLDGMLARVGRQRRPRGD